MAMGEAAGQAAATVATKKIAFAELNVSELREALRRHGAVV
jgi:Mg/Co/Ni transporter MgtE